ncbi:Asparagine synthetase [glutamine-hydrolyzing] 3 (fragment) [Xenorhabdus nematophila ATCC 19061]|uniref:asparagine synthase (glutamine-hydrolyzing) n=1 Tax=Xenorhabdus nematophila (strain ATCC 19061 / DSM 3370 / CCUG 14189 / LMG 1036 / NCIMB 9965 / AN6) TaxID=406817 RepID=D3VJM8_XENNA
MCGITGWLSYNQYMKNHRNTIQKMTDTVSNRGPDAQGIWIEGPVALGHRRLSIIDLYNFSKW